MALTSTLQLTLLRHQREIQEALQQAVMKARNTAIRSGAAELQAFYDQIQYHLGWVDASFSPVTSNAGKMLRPTLLLLAYEAAGAWGMTSSEAGYLRRALPAAAAVELTHNFTLIHDDIEDGDAERRHRPTLWKLWGIPQAINTGDGLFALARLTLWGVLDEGVEGIIAARLGAVLDEACLVLSEGQYLDISFEERQDISVAAYVDMISRKTAALMACAAQMGAMLGTENEEAIERLRSAGHALGIAFQVRDDLLGVWATTAELGKTPAGDVYRRKKSLPFLHALEHAEADDQRYLREVFQQGMEVTSEQVEEVLAIFARSRTKAYCCAFLAEQCRLATEALENVPRVGHPEALRAIGDIQTLINFVEEASKE
jgi:geranylgeranyl diphosphate synthase, type I